VVGRRVAVAVACLIGCVSPIRDEQPFVEVETEHLKLYSNGFPELAVAITERLELFHVVGRELLNADTVEERLPTYVYLLDDALWYGPLASRQNLRGVLVPHPHANYLTVRALSQRDEALRLVQNLYVRILLQTRQSQIYPRWYETGMSELLGTLQIQDDEVLIGRVSRMRRGVLERGFQERNQRGINRGAPRRATWVPFRTLMLARAERTWPRDRRYAFYAESWALTFYLTWKRPEQLRDYLERVIGGEDHDAAFAAAFGMSHLALEQQVEHFFRGRERLWRMPAEQFQVRANPRLVELEEPRWNALLGELLNARRLPEQAAIAEQNFERAIDGEPELASAHAGLATALVLQNKPGGDDDVERALELAPDDARTRMVAGEYFLARARAVPGVERTNLERARRELERALELASDLPGAYYALGLTYLLPGEDPRLAIAPLEQAHDLIGWQRDVTLALGEAHARTGQEARARDLLERVVRGTNNPDTRKRAEDLLAQLDASGQRETLR
jgi:tetratricopeptide (TPR) repeat protein